MLNCSFPLRDLSESLTVAHLSLATWGIRSRLLISSEDLSDSLTVAHLSWAIWANRSQSFIWFEQNEQKSKWANEQMSEWAMSEWANSQPCRSQIISASICVKFNFRRSKFIKIREFSPISTHYHVAEKYCQLVNWSYMYGSADNKKSRGSLTEDCKIVKPVRGLQYYLL